MSVNTIRAPRIVVLGSINMDLVVRCQDLPVAGQTILAESSREFCGGKGANQAVAAALAGGEVSMIGAVGGDAVADRLIDNLKMRNVNCDAVWRCEDQASGLAVIAVDSRGQNSIMVVPGANSAVTPERVRAVDSIIQAANCLMVQLEIPLESVLEGIRIARSHGVQVILDPAPAPTDFPKTLLEVDLICPNETEATALTKLPVTTTEEAQAAAIRLHAMGAKNVAITMGAHGTLLYCDGQATVVPAFGVDAIDTTAAGDAFAGALAVRWAQCGELRDAVLFANSAGAIAASRSGAQDSIATHEEILKFGKLIR